MGLGVRTAMLSTVGSAAGARAAGRWAGGRRARGIRELKLNGNVEEGHGRTAVHPDCADTTPKTAVQEVVACRHA